MSKRIFPNFNLNLPPPYRQGRFGRFRCIFFLWVISTFFLLEQLYAQNNLSIQLDNESLLINQLVICNGIDEQSVVFSITGDNPLPRTNITATLQFFKGIEFDKLNVAETTPGISVSNQANPTRPIFNFPDLDPNNLEELTISFSVKANCDILDTLVGSTDVQIFDTWTLDYQLGGVDFSETLEGIEYRDGLAIPNLNINIEDLSGPFSIGQELTRTITITNSGLNSFLSEFIYQVNQEAGVLYKSILVNGTSVEFTKEASGENDSLIIANIAGNSFLNNQLELGQLGNNDTLFDIDEIVIIEETIQIISCGIDGNTNINSLHQASWGCEGSSCQSENSTITLDLGVGEALIQFSQNEETINPSYCDTGTLSISVANNGFEFDEGFANIFDIATGIGFAVGTEFLASEQGYVITQISIANTTVAETPNGLINLSNHPDFTTDPDGNGGLEDLDNDGFYDDLALGESFEVVAAFTIDCSDGNQLDAASNCDNDFRGNFDGKIEYKDICGLSQEVLFDNFHRSSNTGDTKEVCSDPDAFNDEDEFTISYAGERRIVNFNQSCAESDQIIANVNLPEGIIISNKTTLSQDTFNLSATIQGDSSDISLVFDAASFNFNNDYNLNFVFETQCAALGSINIPVEISYFCPSCDCTTLWYCGTLEGPVLHAAGAPCADFVCETGLQTTNFEVERTSFGFESDDFSSPFDPALANKKVALSCDSVLMKVTNIVGNQSLTDSLGIIISHENADESDSIQQTFLFNFATITIETGGNTTTCLLDTTHLTLERSGDLQVLNFDLSSCISSALTAGSRIGFEGHFSISADGPIPSNTFKKIPNLRAKGYAIRDGVLFDECDSFGELFHVGKLNTTFTGPSNNTFPQGCAATSMTYTLTKSINPTAWQTFFGTEQRRATRIESTNFLFDPNILSAFEDLSVEYRIQGSPWQPLPSLSLASSGEYSVDFSSLNTVSTISGNNQVFQIRINVSPNCSSAFGSSTGNDLYEMETQISFLNRYYTDFSGDATCIDPQNVFDKRFIQYQNPPEFSFEGIVSDVQIAERNVQWIVEHCNTSFESDAGISWISIENIEGDVSILSIENISDPTAIDTLTIQFFGVDNIPFSITNGLDRRTINANPQDICNTFRITARVNSCGENSVLARVGWDCIPYDDPSWTPAEFAPCEEESIRLQVETLDPFLAANFVEDESIISGLPCDTSTIVLLIRNEEVGNAYDIQSQIILPQGAMLVPNSITFAYPSSSSLNPVSINPSFIGEDVLGAIYQYDDFTFLSPFLQENGLPSFDVNAPDSSEFKISYQFVTSCNFENNALNRYRFQGVSSCDEPTNTAFGETTPIIFQPDGEQARFYSLEVRTNRPLQQGEITTLTLTAQNISNNTSEFDKINISLPEGLNFIENTTLGIYPSTWIPGAPSIIDTLAGLTLSWTLPDGLVQNDSASLQFQVFANAIDCDSSHLAQVNTTSLVEFNCDIEEAACILELISSDVEDFAFDCLPENCNKKLEDVTVIVPDCDSIIQFCLTDYLPGQLNNFEVADNGVPVDSAAFGSCDFRQICIYTYAQIENIEGPIQIDNWTIDGITYSGTAANINDLVDSMNVWDENGNWVLLPDTLVIQGGHLSRAYSQISVSFPDKGIESILGYDIRLTPVGTTIPLTNGFHELTFIDSLGCTDTLNVTVLLQPNCLACIPPSIENIIIENTKCGENNGAATIRLGNNIENYLFEWTPLLGQEADSPNRRVNLPAGTYTVRIISQSDSNCFTEVSFSIQNTDAPEVGIFTTPPSACNTSDGVVQFSPSQFQYEWEDGTLSADRTDLPSGIYSITVTDPTQENCSDIITISLEGQNNLEVSHNVLQAPTCLNNSGEIELVVTGGSGNYISSFPDQSLTQSSLSGGSYLIEITDVNTDCSISYLLLLNNEIHSGNITIQDIINPNCAGEATGSIQFEVNYENGFNFPADTLITDGISFFENGNLPQGNFQIYIRDDNDCVAGSAAFSIIEPSPLSLEISKEGNCETSQSINLDVTGGAPPYTFDWADLPGIDNIQNRDNLTEINYEVTITDDNACTLSLPISIEECPCVPPEATATIFPSTCTSPPTGTVVLTPAQYIYTWPDGFVGENRNMLAPGIYEIRITDTIDTSCEGTIIVEVVAENQLAAEVLIESNATCNEANGSATILVSGGSGDYTYSWDSDTNVNTNLAADNYSVTIFDATLGCQLVTDFEIISIEPCDTCTPPTITNISITPTSCERNSGAIFIEIAEPESDYDFLFTLSDGTTFFGGSRTSNLAEGIYQITIIDKSNTDCSVETVVEIREQDFSDLVPATSPADCGLQNGKALLLPTTNIYTWSDGFIGNFREDLEAGFYEISVIDTAFACTTTLSIVVNEINLLQTKVVINTPPTCGNADGSVTIEVSGGSGEYDFSWEVEGNTNNNLASGTYNILIIDRLTGCRIPSVFSLINAPNNLVDIQVVNTEDASCPLEADGSVSFTTNLENVVGRELDTLISNGLSIFQDDRLPQGDYCITVIDTLGCAFGQACFTINAPDFIETSIETIPECEEGGSISIEVSGGVAPYTFNWADLDSNNNPTERTDLIAGRYDVTITDANGCSTTIDSIEITQCEPCPLQVGKDTLIYFAEDCESTTQICLNYDIDPLNPLEVILNGNEIDLFEINSCGTDTIDLYSYATLLGFGRISPYQVTSWPVNDQVFSGSFNTLEELIDSMNIWDPLGDWQLSEKGAFIEGGSPGTSYGSMEAILNATQSEFSFNYQIQIIQKGISIELPVGAHTITIQDPKTFCEDSLAIGIACTKVDTIEMTTFPGQLDTLCFTADELLGNFSTLEVIGQDEALVNISVFNDTCTIIEGINIGNDVFQVVVCDDLTICDTTFVSVSVIIENINDTILINTPTTICLDTANLSLPGSITSMEEICGGENGPVIFDLDPDETCITYTGQTIGQDTACIEICDNLGNCDTLNFTITVRNDPPDEIMDTIFINETIIYCFDTLVLPGSIVFFENICPESSGENVDFFLDPINYCIEYTGVDIGRESACIVICDTRNICDSAFFDVEVIEFGELPVAVDDVDTTDRGVPIVLNVRENDIAFGVTEEGLTIVEEPLFGEVFINLDGSITYFNDDFCERNDEFTYSICNDIGCDTATVTIYIRCIDIVVFTALSPNGDGVNDEFFISGVEEFPNSVLTIYNRWGNIVYRATNYQNDWTGTWRNNQDLPDGTYFYQLELNEPDNNRRFEGFLELHR